jgi:hypothetical protein
MARIPKSVFIKFSDACLLSALAVVELTIHWLLRNAHISNSWAIQCYWWMRSERKLLFCLLSSYIYIHIHTATKFLLSFFLSFFFSEDALRFVNSSYFTVQILPVWSTNIMIYCFIHLSIKGTAALYSPYLNTFSP